MISIQVSEGISVASTSKVKSLLRRAVMETLQQAGASSRSDLSIVLTGDSQLHELNRQHLGIDAPTDVLSFPAGETDPDSGELYLGDILVSYPRAQAQSAASGHSLQDELQLLVVHGVLHLLGFDHADGDQQDRMWAAQRNVLERLGCQIQAPGQVPD